MKSLYIFNLLVIDIMCNWDYYKQDPSFIIIIRLSEIYQYCSLKMKLCTNSVNIHFIQLCFYHKVACFFLLILQFPSSALWRGFNSANKLMVCARRLILSILFSLRFTSQATILCIFFFFRQSKQFRCTTSTWKEHWWAYGIQKNSCDFFVLRAIIV